MMSITNPYQQAKFLTSAAKINQLPDDEGFEIAFAGRSNAGKSSALNCLTTQKNLAKTSKTPGRTQLINLFEIDEQRRLVDLPGYGYAKVSQQTKQTWQKHLADYLEKRQCLVGLILLMDIRHPLKELDAYMIDWCVQRGLPVHVLLTKADKVSKSDANQAMRLIQKNYDALVGHGLLTCQPFSSTKKTGLPDLIEQLNHWFNIQN